jgi:HEAT repeat protein
MADNTNVEQLVASIPDLDKAGKIDGPRPQDADKTFEALLTGGREAIDKLLGMIREVDDGQDWKARYVIHGLAVYVCRPSKAQQRGLVVDAIVAKLQSDAPKAVKAALIRELQVAGCATAAPVLGKFLADDELYTWAASALLAIRQGAAGEFRKALPAAKGRAKATIIQNLGLLRDPEAVQAIKQAAVSREGLFGDGDSDVRLAICGALANLGDEAAVDTLIMASNAEGWERIQAAKACLVLAEKLAAAGKKPAAEKIYRHLRDTRKDDEKYLRDLAAAALD